MTITSFNPSELINSLEYNLYKGVSRSKTDNQQKIEACILEADKITEQKSAAYRKEAMVMVACAVGMIAFAMIGIAIDWKSETIKSDLSSLSNVNLSNLSTEQASSITQSIADLEKSGKILSAYKNIINGFSLGAQKGPDAYSSFSRVSTNRLDHKYKKQEMRWSQLHQELSNSSTQSVLNDIKEVKRRQQQAKTAAG